VVLWKQFAVGLTVTKGDLTISWRFLEKNGMIKSFNCKETEKIYRGEYSKKIPADIQQCAMRKLVMLSAARTLSDLRVPPANGLESLFGDSL
jgi:hypothetical protein